jgi:hypothetical protein
MPHGNVDVKSLGPKKVVVTIDLPDQGEPSLSGRAENLLDPSQWIRFEHLDERLSLKVTLCRPYQRSVRRVS